MVMKLLSIMAFLFPVLNKNLATKIVGTRRVMPKLIKSFSINDESVNINGNKWLRNEHTLYLKDNEYIKDKKLISISPGGFKGFYMLGTSAFIKENFNLENYIFSGASAGAWNSLFMTFKRDPIEFIIEMLDEKLNNAISNIDVEYAIKYKILNKYSEDDFDLKRLFIGVTSFENMKIKTHIFSDFDTLEDALNCCIASSHIPYITGSTFLNKYQNMNAFDGGFSKYPYLNVIKPSLHITPEIWKDDNVQKTYVEKLLTFQSHVSDYTTLFSRSKYNFADLFDKGYDDAKKNKLFLDNKLIN
jgi:hypothetical protein